MTTAIATARVEAASAVRAVGTTVVTHPINTPSIAGGWVYYLLGRDNRQLAVYHGQQDTGNVCDDTAAGVLMYSHTLLKRQDMLQSKQR